MAQVLDRVAFVIATPFHYHLFSSIIDELLALGVECDLVLYDAFQYQPEWKRMYEALVAFVQGVERDDIQAVPASLLLNHGLRYECVVSPYFMDLLVAISVKNVRVMYGLAKEPWNFAWWNVFYDKICCFGPYDFARLNIYDTCVQVGHVRFDRWFKGLLPSEDTLREHFGLVPGRETILYAPTYGDLSSLDVWLPQIADLQKQYNVIVKLHHGTAHRRSERKRRRAVRGVFTCVLDDTHDQLWALKVADYLFSDSSGVVFDGLLAGKPIVLLEANVKSALTNEQSAEQVIRRELATARPGQDLAAVLEQVRRDSERGARNQLLVQRFFSNTDGHASKRAAHAIVDVFRRKMGNSNVFLASLRQKCFARPAF